MASLAFEDLLARLRQQHLLELSVANGAVQTANEKVPDDLAGILRGPQERTPQGTPVHSINLPKASLPLKSMRVVQVVTDKDKDDGEVPGEPSPLVKTATAASTRIISPVSDSNGLGNDISAVMLQNLPTNATSLPDIDLGAPPCQPEGSALSNPDDDESGFHLRRLWRQEPMAGEKMQWGESVHVSMARAYMQESKPKLGTRKSRSFVMEELTSVAKMCCSLASLRRQLQSPIGNFHLFWDVIGIILICYDLIAIPLQAFRLKRTTWTVTLDWITLTFWTVDIAQSFITGYFEKGQLIVSPRKIAKRYLRTWFVVDLCIVLPEWWAAVIDQSGNNVAGLGRIFRGTRAIRVLRLLRLLKLQRIKDRFYDSIETEWAFIISTLVRLLVFILLLNHVVACGWYLVGRLSMDAGLPSWIEFAGIEDRGLDYRYTTSLHWSLTQFTPASMDVSARNVPERVFSIVVLFFAMVVFSSVVASITSSMTSLRNIVGQRMQEFWRLRKYMRQQDISEDLKQRILKFLEFQCNQREKMVQASSIGILALLSEPLQKSLASEINAKHLSTHPFFQYMEEQMVVVMHWICKRAVRSEVLAGGDVVFYCGDTASEMRFIVEGSLHYEGEGLIDVNVGGKEWVSEAVLWTTWRHMGKLNAVFPTELLILMPDHFAEVMRMHPIPWFFARSYAKKFVEFLNNPDGAWLSDVHPRKNDDFFVWAISESATGPEDLSPLSPRTGTDRRRPTRRGFNMPPETEEAMGNRISEIYRRSSHPSIYTAATGRETPPTSLEI